MMARIGLLGRIMLLLLGALSVLVIVTVTIDRWQIAHRPFPWNSASTKLRTS